MKEKHSKYYTQWTREEFEALPIYGNFVGDPNSYEEKEVDCFVVLPTEKFHDSGYRLIDVVVIKGDKPIGRFVDCADGVNLICENARKWGLDWLPVSGLMRIWNCGGNCEVELPWSTFTIKTYK